MRNFKITFCFTLILSFFLFLIGCEYDAILPTPPPDDVRFQDHIMTIFNESCNSSGCHSGPEDFEPDLSLERAYNALWEGNYIDTMIPENSSLYRSMVGDGIIPMPPPDGASTSDSETILKWIELGAKDN